MKHIFQLLAIALIFNCGFSKAQVGAIDNSFLKNDVGFKATSQFNGEIQQALPLRDGKILIAGHFTNYSKWGLTHLARLNADGTVDSTFICKEGFYPYSLGFNDIVELEDSTVILIGSFRQFNGKSIGNIIKLNYDGSLVDDFCKDVGRYGYLTSIAIQKSDKIIVGGTFSQIYGNEDFSRIARLHKDGSLDTSFNAQIAWEIGVFPKVNDIEISENGTIIVGGDFEEVNNSSTLKYLLSLDSNGSIDTTSIKFNTTSLTSVRVIKLQEDGKILVGGNEGVKRFLPDGSEDGSFSQPNYIGNIYDIQILPNNSIVITGDIEGNENILKLNSNGEIDSNFSGPKILNEKGLSCKIFGDSKILLAGNFYEYEGGDLKYLTLLDSIGTIDTSFNINKGSLDIAFDQVVNKILVQPNQKIILGGAFNSFFNDSVGNIVRLHKSGEIDQSFNTGKGFSGGMVKSMALQGDKIIVGGTFNDFNETAAFGITRLNEDGSLDNTFASGTGVGYGWSSRGGHHVAINCIEVLENNKIYIAGRITEYNGDITTHIARLNSDGTLDKSFKLESNIHVGQANYGVKSIAIQDDGKIVVVGNIHVSTNSGGRSFVFRLNDDGSFDESFTNADGNLSAWARACVVQNDGKIVVGGLFGAIGNNWGNNNIIRLNINGSLDPTFQSGTGCADASGISGLGSSISKLVLQNDGKILVGGEFESFNGHTSKRIIRLNADGSLDPTFQSGTGISKSNSAANIVTTATVTDIALQADGNILVSGELLAYNDVGRSHLVRIIGENIITSEEPLYIISNDIQVYPNPSSGIFKLNVPAKEVQILDINGQPIWKGKNVTSINLKNYSNGVYILISDGSYKKLIKR